MTKFNNARDLERHLKKAADALLAETLITTQAELGSTKVSPYDTGRFRSSWFAAEDQSSDDVAPEGADIPNTDARGLEIDSSKEYHITNNLPYAQAIAIEGASQRVVSQPKTWFTSFRNQRIPEISDTAAKVIKTRYGL
jgi:hypothetical protein